MPNRANEIIALLNRIVVALEERDRPEGLRAEAAAKFIGVSRSTFYDLDNRGLVPAGVEVGNIKVWSKSELSSWLRAGAPTRQTWMAIRETRLRRTG